MITEHDLQEAIAECQGQRNPNASTCLKLAAFYTIRNEMFGKKEEIPSYSYAEAPKTEAEKTVNYWSDSEFSEAINGKNANDIWAIMDELMSILSAVNPNLYNGVMRKINV